MPKVGKMEFPYTAKGKAKAKAYSVNTGEKIVKKPMKKMGKKK